ARILYLGYLLLLDRLDQPEPISGTVAASVLQRAQKAGLKTILDLVSEEGDRFTQIVRPALKFCDYCVVNEFEAERTTGIEIVQTTLRMLAPCRGIRLPANSKTMIKSLDNKIADIRANPSGSKAFIIADAKDADMAFGIGAPGPRRNSKINEYDSSWKSLEDYRAQIRDVVRQGIVDIMLLSASNLETLAMEERLFENSAVTPAARANDTSDVWAV